MENSKKQTNLLLFPQTYKRLLLNNKTPKKNKFKLIIKNINSNNENKDSNEVNKNKLINNQKKLHLPKIVNPNFKLSKFLKYNNSVHESSTKIFDLYNENNKVSDNKIKNVKSQLNLNINDNSKLYINKNEVLKHDLYNILKTDNNLYYNYYNDIEPKKKINNIKTSLNEFYENIYFNSQINNKKIELENLRKKYDYLFNKNLKKEEPFELDFITNKAYYNSKNNNRKFLKGHYLEKILNKKDDSNSPEELHFDLINLLQKEKQKN